MPKFTYRVRDKEGRLQTGTMDGNTVDECVRRLEDKSLIPVSIEELNFDGSRKNRSVADRMNELMLTSKTKVPYRTVVFFTRQLATLIQGGVSLPRAIEQLAKNETAAFKKMLDRIGEDLAMGSTFSDALAKHPGTFNNMFVSVVRAGEVSGALDQVLDELATYMENAEAMKSKVKGAMRYPAMIALMVSGVTAIVLIFLVPIFSDMYAGLGANLPLPTRILMSISDTIRYNALATAVIAALSVIFVALVFILSDKARSLFDKYLLKLPTFGEIVKKNILAIYCRTTSLLMNSGTPILEATQIAGAAVNNKFYAAALEKVYYELKQGELLSVALIKAKEFPPLVTQLVSTGEESGKIDELLRKAAEFYDREIRNVVDSLASIIEPILIVILGGLVGGMLIALYLPVFMVGQIIN